MGRVGDDAVGCFHGVHLLGLHHLPVGFLALLADLRVAFHLLVFIADLLLGHHEVLLELPVLVEVIERGEDDEGDGERDGEADHGGPGSGRDAADALVGFAQGGFEVRANRSVGDEAKDDQLEQAAREFDGPLRGEDASQARDGVEAGPLGNDGVPGEEEPDLREIDGD